MANLCVLFFPGVKEVDAIIEDIVNKHKDSYESIVFTDEIDKCISDNVIVVYCDFMSSIVKMSGDDMSTDNVIKSFNELRRYINMLDTSIENLFVESEDIDIDDTHKYFILEILEEFKNKNK